jgi:predicted RNA binding protein YcfA (HicA-like mRNA interferase family)
MPSALPVLSGCEVVRVFETFGWQVARQSASHIIMVKAGEQVTLSVPDHREVAKGTLRSLIRTVGITVQEFVSSTR